MPPSVLNGKRGNRRLQPVPKQYYIQVQRTVGPKYSSNVKVNLKFKVDNTFRCQKFLLRTGAKMRRGYRDHNPTPFKYDHCRKNTQLITPKSLQKGWDRLLKQK